MPETWSMLHSLYALKSKGYEAEYNAEWARIAIRDFLDSLPNGEDAYYESISKMHSHLYQLALDSSGKKYFLDKTPRYFHVIPELYKTFPEATFIILFRNPLAVLCSIITTWIKDKEQWSSLKEYELDLLMAPSLLMQGIQHVPESNLLQIHYEEFISKPTQTVRSICDRLHIQNSDSLLCYSPSQQKGFGYDEQIKSVHQSGKPNADNLDRWIHELKDPQVWRTAKDYLELLGEDTISKMGYEYEELSAILHTHKPTRIEMWETVPLRWLFRKPEGLQKWSYYLLRLNRSRKKSGIRNTWSKAQLSVVK